MKREPRILKASRLLQSKVGFGTVDPERIKKSQAIIDNNSVDFGPMAQEYLAALETALNDNRQAIDNSKAVNISAIREPVMEIKANAPMFNFSLIGAMARVMLDFLEKVEALDNDALDIVEAFAQTLKLILKNKMKGDGGAYGKELENELEAACRRYFAKNGEPLFGGAEDAFFIDID